MSGVWVIFRTLNERMNEEYIEIINRLESLQYDILFWKRKEQDQEKIKRLEKYDSVIDGIIEYIEQLED